LSSFGVIDSTATSTGHGRAQFNFLKEIKGPGTVAENTYRIYLGILLHPSHCETRTERNKTLKYAFTLY